MDIKRISLALITLSLNVQLAFAMPPKLSQPVAYGQTPSPWAQASTPIKLSLVAAQQASSTQRMYQSASLSATQAPTKREAAAMQRPPSDTVFNALINRVDRASAVDFYLSCKNQNFKIPGQSRDRLNAAGFLQDGQALRHLCNNLN